MVARGHYIPQAWALHPCPDRRQQIHVFTYVHSGWVSPAWTIEGVGASVRIASQRWPVKS